MPAVRVIIPGQGSEILHDAEIEYDDEGVAWVVGTAYEDGGTYYMPIDAHYIPYTMSAKARWILSCHPSYEDINGK